MRNAQWGGDGSCESWGSWGSYRPNGADGKFLMGNGRDGVLEVLAVFL